jgi:hypothetical protein
MKGGAAWKSWTLSELPFMAGASGGLRKLRPSSARRYVLVRTESSLQRIDTQDCYAGDPQTCQRTSGSTSRRRALSPFPMSRLIPEQRLYGDSTAGGPGQQLYPTSRSWKQCDRLCDGQTLDRRWRGRVLSDDGPDGHRAHPHHSHGADADDNDATDSTMIATQRHGRTCRCSKTRRRLVAVRRLIIR